PTIVSMGVGLPPHRYRQAELVAIAQRALADSRWSASAIAKFFKRVGVEERYFALPAETYASLEGFEQRNKAWLEVATSLGARVVRDALARAGVEPSEVSLLSTTTVTGIA